MTVTSHGSGGAVPPGRATSPLRVFWRYVTKQTIMRDLGDTPASGDDTAAVTDAFARMRARYPELPEVAP